MTAHVNEILRELRARPLAVLGVLSGCILYVIFFTASIDTSSDTVRGERGTPAPCFNLSTEECEKVLDVNPGDVAEAVLADRKRQLDRANRSVQGARAKLVKRQNEIQSQRADRPTSTTAPDRPSSGSGNQVATPQAPNRPTSRPTPSGGGGNSGGSGGGGGNPPPAQRPKPPLVRTPEIIVPATPATPQVTVPSIEVPCQDTPVTKC